MKQKSGWEPDVDHVHYDIPGVRFAEVSTLAIIRLDVFRPEQGQHVCLGRGVLRTPRFVS